jgi:prepilin peptidase CpaA
MTALLNLQLTSLQIGMIAVILAIAVVTDIRKRKIYNALTLPAMALGIVISGIGDGVSGALSAVAGLLLGAALFALPVALLGRGAGDLKLLAALGALGGPIFVIWCALLTGVAGGLMAAAVLASQRRFGVALAGMALDVGEGRFPEARSGIRLPYAVPIAVGALASLVLV